MAFTGVTKSSWTLTPANSMQVSNMKHNLSSDASLYSKIECSMNSTFKVIDFKLFTSYVAIINIQLMLRPPSRMSQISIKILLRPYTVRHNFRPLVN